MSVNESNNETPAASAAASDAAAGEQKPSPSATDENAVSGEQKPRQLEPDPPMGTLRVPI